MKIQKKIIYLYFLLALLLPTYNVWTQDEISFEEETEQYIPEAEGLIISEIKIIKPKRTKIARLQNVIPLKKGDTYTIESHSETYLALWETQNFSEINITPTINEENTVIVTIEVVDKWTLIPTPIFSASEGNIQGGLALIESNLFGYGKNLIVVGIVGNSTLTFSTIYVDNKLGKSNLGLTFVNYLNISQYVDTTYGNASIYNKENEKVNTIVRQSQGLSTGSNAQLSYTFKNKLKYFNEIGFFYYNNDIFLDDSFEATNNQYEDTIIVPLTVGLEYTRYQPYSVLQKGYSATAEYTIPTYASTGFFQKIQINAQYDIGLDKKQINLLTFYTNAWYGNAPLIYSSSTGGTDTTRSIARNSIKSSALASAAVEHSIIVWTNNFAGIVVGYGGDSSVYEVTGYEEIDPVVWNGGVFLTTGVRLKTVAIPLAKLNVGYNVPGEYMTVSFTIGNR